MKNFDPDQNVLINKRERCKRVRVGPHTGTLTETNSDSGVQWRYSFSLSLQSFPYLDFPLPPRHLLTHRNLITDSPPPRVLAVTREAKITVCNVCTVSRVRWDDQYTVATTLISIRWPHYLLSSDSRASYVWRRSAWPGESCFHWSTEEAGGLTMWSENDSSRGDISRVAGIQRQMGLRQPS